MSIIKISSLILNKQYKAKIISSETNEKKELFINAKSEIEAKDFLIKLGFTEPFDIKEIKAGKPTPKQLEYAKSLNIRLPLEVTKLDLSALIDKKLENDDSPHEALLIYASEKGLLFSQYAGEKALYTLIFDNLLLDDKIAFYIFSVYKHLSDDTSSNLNVHKYKDLIYKYVDEIKGDEKIVKSICNYRGSELIHFGKIKYSDDIQARGGSVNTYAYKAVSAYISKTFNTTKTKTINSEKSSGYRLDNKGSKKSGCAPMIALIVLIVILMLVL